MYLDHVANPKDPKEAPNIKIQRRRGNLRAFFFKWKTFCTYRIYQCTCENAVLSVIQLVVPKALCPVVIQACHDLPEPGERLAFKATYDKVRDRYWWPTMSTDITQHCK